MNPVVASVNIVFAEIDDIGGSVGRTSIDKRSVAHRVAVTTAGLAGDQRSDLKNHGSTDQAVYAYSATDLDWWSAQLGRTVTPGQFGENLTIANADVNNWVIGAELVIGSAKLQVTSPRIPCGTFARWLGEEQWVRRFTEANRCGSYLRCLTAGEFEVGDEVVIESIPVHGVTIRDCFQVLTGNRDADLVRRVADCPDLTQANRDKVAKFQ